ncbi:MAG: HAD family hydrolase [Candidatus Paceibacterota bacterium]
MIRLIIFDFLGTLGYYDPAEYHEVFTKLREFNLPVNEGKPAKVLAEILPDFFSDADSWKDLTNKIIQKLGIVLEQDRRESLEAFLERKLTCKLYDDVEDILSLPQDKAILTLSGKFVIDSISQLSHFEVFSPKIAGAKKPDEKAFLAVLEKMQADPEEAMMVGDSLENDILPALALGMKAILIDRGGIHPKIDDPSIIKISSLGELKRYL